MKSYFIIDFSESKVSGPPSRFEGAALPSRRTVGVGVMRVLGTSSGETKVFQIKKPYS